MLHRAGLGILVLLGVAAVLAACGGGGSGSIPSTGNPTAGSTGPSAAMTFHFPAPSTASAARTPRYLSRNTTSVKITITAVNGVPPSPAIPPTTIAIAPGQGSCTALTSSGFTCIATVGAVVGNDTFLIQAYSSTGALLSSGTLTVAVNPGVATTIVTQQLVLGAVTTSATISTPAPSAGSVYNATQGTWIPPVDGKTNTLTFTISATDASGNTIVGALASPIPIALTDPSGTTPSNGTLSYSVYPAANATPSASANGTNIIAVPANITLTYSGASFYGPGTPTSGTNLKSGTLQVGIGSTPMTIAIAPLQVAASISLTNATVGIPFNVTATEAGVSGATFTATAASSGGTLQAVCPPPAPPPTGATTPCSANSGIVTFDVMPFGQGAGGYVITDANGVSVTQSFDVTPQTGGGINVPPHTIREVSGAIFVNAEGLSVGPTGNHIWFGGSNGNLEVFSPASCVGSPTSCISSVSLSPGTSHYPVNLASYQGLLWYTDASANGIFNLAPSTACSGTTSITCNVTTSLSAVSSVTGDFVVSPSGFMLFSTQLAAYYAYSPISQSWTTVSEANQLVQAALGPNGNAFVTEKPTTGGPSLGEIISPGAPTTDFSYNSLSFCAPSSGTISDPNNDLSGLATGSDGNLWVVEGTSRKVDVLSTAGATAGAPPCVVAQYPLPTPPPGTLLIPDVYTAVEGPDGNIWITDPPNNSIDRITPSGAVTAISIPSASANPYDIIVGPDGNLWFTEYNTHNIGEVVLQ